MLRWQKYISLCLLVAFASATLVAPINWHKCPHHTPFAQSSPHHAGNEHSGHTMPMQRASGHASDGHHQKHESSEHTATCKCGDISCVLAAGWIGTASAKIVALRQLSYPRQPLAQITLAELFDVRQPQWPNAPPSPSS